MPLDTAAFRASLSRFASGVTVLTTRSADGRDLGMTATAFSSLSLDPPMVLVCIDRAASIAPPSWPAASIRCVTAQDRSLRCP